MLFGNRKKLINRILVVEDEPLTAFDNENMISEAGYEVVATHDRYADALATLDREKVDLILSDVRLTGERTGIDLAKLAKERGVPILFATGHAPDNAADLAIGVLLKPYSERTLRQALQAIDDHLQGKKARPPKGLTLHELTAS